VSSANKIVKDLLFIILGRPLIQRMNNKVPIIDPCGTPCFTSALLDKVLSVGINFSKFNSLTALLEIRFKPKFSFTSYCIVF